MDYNTSDVVVKDKVTPVEETGRELNEEEKVKTRAYDMVLPYKTTGWLPKVLIQSQFYAGDSGSVAHKTVDQATASRRDTTRILGAGVRFVEYLDGAGFLGSLNSDLRSLLAMPDTAFVLQMRSIPIRLRRVFQEVGFLTPLEVEHAILATNGKRKAVSATLAQDGYSRTEIVRVIDDALRTGLLVQQDGRGLGVRTDRRDQARVYAVLDAVAIHGQVVDSVASVAHGFVSIPGYGPYYGLTDQAARVAALSRMPAFSTDWPDDVAFQADLMHLAQQNFVTYTPPLVSRTVTDPR